MSIITKLAMHWMKKAPLHDKARLAAELIGPEYGMVIAPTEKRWVVEWPDGAINASIFGASIGMDFTHNPPRTVFGEQP